jgi:uridine kinase
MPADGVLVVDGVFAMRPQLDSCWDLRIWLHIDPELSLRRGIARDTEMEGGARAAETLHRDRYLVVETLYMQEHDPMTVADVVIDNTDFDRPVIQPVVR